MDLGLSVFFESLYTNIVMPRMIPIVEGRNMSIDGNNFKLVIFNISSDVNECIRIGEEIIKHILFMQPETVTDFIQKKFGLYSEITFFI